jgi:hypothetical protein
MRIQRGLLALFAVALLTVAACGAGTPAGPSAATVQSAIEGATKVKLVSQPLGAGAPSGAAVFTNTTTITTDLQLVAVVVADTAATAKSVADSLAPSLAGLATAKTYTNKNVVVVYAALPGGTDNSAAVDAAVKGF